MLDIVDTDPERRPAILICAYSPDDGVWDPAETLDGAAWSPPGVRSITVPGGDPDGLAAGLSEHLANGGCRALLLVGRSQSTGDFRVQMRAERARPRGVGGNGPSVARSTAPVADIVRALQDAGLPAAASSDSEDDAGSYILYRILTALPDGDAPAIGLLRAPMGMKSETVRSGVKAAASAIARRLHPLPRLTTV